MKRPKTTRVPRTRAGGEWTEAQFWQFIRNNMRDMSRRWPPIARHALERARRPSQLNDARTKWQYQCQDCLEWFTRKNVQVDHRESAGSLRSFADVSVFVERLLVEADGLDVRCKECHGRVTQERLDRK